MLFALLCAAVAHSRRPDTVFDTSQRIFQEQSGGHE